MSVCVRAYVCVRARACVCNIPCFKHINIMGNYKNVTAAWRLYIFQSPNYEYLNCDV